VNGRHDAAPAPGPDRLTPEQDLLLLLARVRPLQDADARVKRLLERQLCWSEVVRDARHHGLLPLLHHHLVRLGAPGVPAEVLREGFDAVRAAAVLNGLQARELCRVLGALHAAAIRAIPLKGVALAESLYGDVALRVSTDMDILVPRSAVPGTLEVLGELGYRAESSERFFLASLLRSDIELALLRREGPLEHAFDLHWGLAWPGARERAALDALWEAARRTTFRDAPAWAMTCEWELLFLALHAARHRWRLLKWLVDIDAVCARGEMDWAGVLDTARRFGWETPFRVSLAVCERLLGTSLPDGFRGGRVPAWVPLFPATVPEDATQDALVPLRLRERPAEKLGHLARVLLVPTLAERRLVRLPAAARLLYYPLRPLRLAGKWGARLLAASIGPR
jgi:hypothetical protein